MNYSEINNDNNSLIDKENKIILFWTPKAACTTGVSLFYKNMDIFDETKEFHWIHKYRDTFYRKYGRINNNLLKDKSYFKFKIVRNPYNRAVSSYNVMTRILIKTKSKDIGLTFREFLYKLKNKVNINSNINYHSIVQYSKADEYLDKMVKIENIENELKNIDKELSTKLYDSYEYIKKEQNNTHITPKNKSINYFVGDIKESELVKIGIPDYKYFYDSEIKKLVEEIYADDIKNYNYEYPF